MNIDDLEEALEEFESRRALANAGKVRPAEVRGRIENQRTISERTIVEVLWPGNDDWKLLDPRCSQRIKNHSPDGFGWGYSGSGPAQLALAILLELAGPHIACQHYQRLKAEVLARLEWWNGESVTPFHFTIDVERWLARHENAVRILEPAVA